VPCLQSGANGNQLGLPTNGKAATKCQKTIAAVGAKFVQTFEKELQKCADRVFTCIQQKPTDPKCLPKAEKTCAKAGPKLFTGPRSQREKLVQKLTKGCGAPKPDAAPLLSLPELRETLGLGYEALEAECEALGVPALGSIEEVSACLIHQHECRAQQLLDAQMPRARELLELGGATRP
jgi:hypothetical protein